MNGQSSSPAPVPDNQQDLENFRNDLDIASTFKKLDLGQLRAAESTCFASLALEYNFQQYKNSLQALKSRFSALHPDVEGVYAQRFEQRLNSYTSFVSTVDQMSQLFSQTGVDQVINSHTKALFLLTQVPPHDGDVVQRFLQAGATGDDISHYQAWLRANDWNPLNFPGVGGTFAGLVSYTKNQIPAMQAELDAVRTHGLPTIEGGSYSTGQTAVQVFTVVVTVVLLFFI